MGKTWSTKKIEHVRKLRTKEGLLLDTIAATQGILNSSDRPSPEGLTVVRVEGKSFIVSGDVAIKVLEVIETCTREKLDEVSREIEEQVES